MCVVFFPSEIATMDIQCLVRLSLFFFFYSQSSIRCIAFYFRSCTSLLLRVSVDRSIFVNFLLFFGYVMSEQKTVALTQNHLQGIRPSAAIRSQLDLQRR